MERHGELARITEKQLFLIGGAPRSGTTWIQCILDGHPDISCRGEGLFMRELATPLERVMAERRQALASKNTSLFRHTGGYMLPLSSDTEFLIGTAIVQALHQQSTGKACRAIGEKTPENVFFFPRFKRLFPRAKFIGIARDPRDVLTSAWHFFQGSPAGNDNENAKAAFIRNAIPSLAAGTRAMIALAEHDPKDCMIVTYEALLTAPETAVQALFRFLGVSDDVDIAAACLHRASFETFSGGRAAGTEQSGSFFRKGVSGDWSTTLTAEMNQTILAALGWMFPRFGWTA
jgi:hypothetical protein